MIVNDDQKRSNIQPSLMDVSLVDTSDPSELRWGFREKLFKNKLAKIFKGILNILVVIMTTTKIKYLAFEWNLLGETDDVRVPVIIATGSYLIFMVLFQNSILNENELEIAKEHKKKTIYIIISIIVLIISYINECIIYGILYFSDTLKNTNFTVWYSYQTSAFVPMMTGIVACGIFIIYNILYCFCICCGICINGFGKNNLSTQNRMKTDNIVNPESV